LAGDKDGNSISLEDRDAKNDKDDPWNSDDEDKEEDA